MPSIHIWMQNECRTPRITIISKHLRRSGSRDTRPIELQNKEAPAQQRKRHQRHQLRQLPLNCSTIHLRQRMEPLLRRKVSPLPEAPSTPSRLSHPSPDRPSPRRRHHSSSATEVLLRHQHKVLLRRQHQQLPQGNFRLRLLCLRRRKRECGKL